MAIITVGTPTINFNNDNSFETAGSPVQSSTGYQFFVRTTPPTVVLPDVYLLLIGILRTSEGSYETPLLQKFFPKGFETYTFVPVPAQGRFNGAQLSLLLIPRRRFRNSATNPTQEFEILFDERQYSVNRVTYR